MKKRSNLSKKILAVSLLFSCVLISACIFSPSINTSSSNMSMNTSNASQTPHVMITLVISPLPGDFPVYISNEFINNSSGTTVMNYSEIVAHDYADIPNDRTLASVKNVPYCGYSGNFSKISEIALNDDRVKKILYNGGIIEEIDEFYPYMTQKTGNICYQFYLGLRLEYQGQQKVVYVNETLMKVEEID